MLVRGTEIAAPLGAIGKMDDREKGFLKMHNCEKNSLRLLLLFIYLRACALEV